MAVRVRLLLCLLVLLLLPQVTHAAKIHKVKKKETLLSLSRKYNVTLQELKAANNIANNRISPGDTLVIPPRSVHSEDASSQKNETSYRTRKGDTLKKIAAATGLSIEELKRLNPSLGTKVKSGQVLVLADPAPHREAPAKGKSRTALRHLDLYSQEEFERTLSELAMDDTAKGVDLARNLEKNQNPEQAELKKSAYSFLGTRYRFGGTTRRGIDCSSFVQQVFREIDVNLPRTAREQYGVGSFVATSELQKGDLLFFQTYARYPSHVGIYLGDNKMIHASSSDRRVVISTINTPYYLSRFIGAKRVGKLSSSLFNLGELLADFEVEREEDILANDTLGLGK